MEEKSAVRSGTAVSEGIIKVIEMDHRIVSLNLTYQAPGVTQWPWCAIYALRLGNMPICFMVADHLYGEKERDFVAGKMMRMFVYQNDSLSHQDPDGRKFTVLTDRISVYGTTEFIDTAVYVYPRLGHWETLQWLVYTAKDNEMNIRQIPDHVMLDEDRDEFRDQLKVIEKMTSMLINYAIVRGKEIFSDYLEDLPV